MKGVPSDLVEFFLIKNKRKMIEKKLHDDCQLAFRVSFQVIGGSFFN